MPRRACSTSPSVFSIETVEDFQEVSIFEFEFSRLFLKFENYRNLPARGQLVYPGRRRLLRGLVRAVQDARAKAREQGGLLLAITLACG